MIAIAVTCEANYFHQRATVIAQKDYKTESGYVPTLKDVRECLARAENLDAISFKFNKQLKLTNKS